MSAVYILVLAMEFAGMTVTEDRHGVFTTAEACIVQSDVLMDTVSTNEVFRALAARNEDFMLYVECKEEQANAA